MLIFLVFKFLCYFYNNLSRWERVCGMAQIKLPDDFYFMVLDILILPCNISFKFVIVYFYVFYSSTILLIKFLLFLRCPLG